MSKRSADGYVSGLEVHAAVAIGVLFPAEEYPAADTAGVPLTGRDDRGHLFCSFLVLVVNWELE